MRSRCDTPTVKIAAMQTLSISAPTRQQYFQELTAASDQSPNSIWLAQIIASWLVGSSVLPDSLGLSKLQFQELLTAKFPGVYVSSFAPSGIIADFSRMQEKHDLEKLLGQHCVTHDLAPEYWITILVAACLGNDHLWQDLGLWSRDDLSALLKHNFTSLATLNCHDMKWKKFIYKMLCDAEGIYVCRAPSCEFCQDYLNCYGEED